MKMNLKLEILKIFLVDFNWETGKQKSTNEVEHEVSTSIETIKLTNQDAQEIK
jgi:hypothetical protein